MSSVVGESIRIEAALLEEISAHARSCFPQEAVGFLFGDPFSDKKYVPLRNVAEIPTSGFALDESEIAAAISAEGREPLVLFHSHPTDLPAPSSLDIRGAEPWPRLWHLILGMGVEKRFRCWRIFGDQVYPVPIEIVD